MPPPPQGLKREELPPKEQDALAEQPQQVVEPEQVEAQEPIKKTKADKITIINWCGLAGSFVLFGVFVFLMFI